MRGCGEGVSCGMLHRRCVMFTSKQPKRLWCFLVGHALGPDIDMGTCRLAENAWAKKLEEASESLSHRAALDHVRRVAAEHVEQTDDKGVSWEIDAYFVEWANSEAATQVLEDLLMVSPSVCSRATSVEVADLG